MNRNRLSILLLTVLIVMSAVDLSARDSFAGSNEDRDALAKTSVEIRAAFARGDVPAILAYHHPDVVKSLGPEKFINGRDALQADLTETLKGLKLEWQENRVETLLIHGDTAVELTAFTIKGTPKQGEPFVFKGRAMVVYVRYKESPTGWASIRELIQPAP